jgi:antitoxin (DNA-binding transcriptional repressor) of toxin-antitoxin stability system
MREIEVSELQARWLECLDEVERGVTFVILRDGRVVARLIPEPVTKPEDQGA